MGIRAAEAVIGPRGNSPERRRALRYAESIGSPTLIPAVSAYAEDQDPQVAAEAKRVLDGLSAKGKKAGLYPARDAAPDEASAPHPGPEACGNECQDCVSLVVALPFLHSCHKATGERAETGALGRSAADKTVDGHHAFQDAGVCGYNGKSGSIKNSP
jgi:hypothetical protein